MRGVRDATDLARFGGLPGIQSRDLWKTSSKNNMLLFMQKGSPRKDEDPLAMVTKIHLHYSCQTGMFDQSWTDRFSDFLFMFSLLVVIMSRMLRAQQSISMDFTSFTPGKISLFQLSSGKLLLYSLSFTLSPSLYDSTYIFVAVPVAPSKTALMNVSTLCIMYLMLTYFGYVQFHFWSCVLSLKSHV